MISLKSILDELTDEQIDKLKQKFLTKDIKSFLDKEEYLQTINAFMENGFNVSAAANKSFMHRNTLNYRLDKFKRETGLDLHNVENAFLIKLLIELNQYTRL